MRGRVIHVDDVPDAETLAEMGRASAFDLLGLFRGAGLAQGGEVATGQMPNAVWLYRRPLPDHWAEHDEAVGDRITHALVHEINYHHGADRGGRRGRLRRYCAKEIDTPRALL